MKSREDEAAEVERALKQVIAQERNGQRRSPPPAKRSASSGGGAYRAPSIWDGATYAPVALSETGLVRPYYDRTPDTRGRRAREGS